MRFKVYWIFFILWTFLSILLVPKFCRRLLYESYSYTLYSLHKNIRSLIHLPNKQTWLLDTNNVNNKLFKLNVIISFECLMNLIVIWPKIFYMENTYISYSKYDVQCLLSSSAINNTKMRVDFNNLTLKHLFKF